MAMTVMGARRIFCKGAGVWGTVVPGGVQGWSPSKGSGGLRPLEAEVFCSFGHHVLMLYYMKCRQLLTT